MTELTKRELEIARYVARGMPDKAIACRLGLSIRTVQGHVQAAASKVPGDTAPRHKLVLFFFNLTEEKAG